MEITKHTETSYKLKKHNEHIVKHNEKIKDHDET